MSRSRLLKGAAAVLGTACLALAALPWWLPTGWIRSRIEREASAALGTPVSIGRISLFWTGAEIADLRISNPPSFPGGSVVEIPSLRAAVPLASLLAGKIDGLSVVVTDPAVRLAASPQGSLNVTALGGASSPPAADAPSPGNPILLPEASLRIERGALFLPGDPSSAVRIPLLSVALAPVAGSPVSADARIILEALLPATFGGGAVKAEAAATIRTPGPIEIRSLAVSIPGGSIEASGRIDPAAPAGMDYALDARISASLEKLAGTLGLPLPSGTLSQVLTLSGNAGETTVRLEGRVSDLAHALLRWPPSQLADTVRIRWIPATRTLELSELKLSLAPPGLAAEASGTVVGPGEEGFARSVDLSLAARLDPGETAAAGGLALAADELSGSAKVSGTPDAILLDAAGTGRNVRLSGGGLAAPLTLPEFDTAQKLRIHPLEKRIEIESCFISTDFLDIALFPGSIGWGGNGDTSLHAILEGDFARTSRWAGAFIAWPGGVPEPSGTFTLGFWMTGTPAARTVRSEFVWNEASLHWPDGRTLDPGGDLVITSAGNLSGNGSSTLAIDKFSLLLLDQGRKDLPPRISASAGGIRFSPEEGLRIGQPAGFHVQDLADVRSIMERSGLAPGIPALSGTVSVSAEGTEADSAGKGKTHLALDARSLSVRPEGMPPVSLASLKLGTDVSFDPGRAAFAASGLSLEGTGLSLSTTALDATGGVRILETSVSSSAGKLAGKGSLDLSPLDLLVKGEAGPLFHKKGGTPWDLSWDVEGDSTSGAWDFRAFRFGMPAGTLEGSGRVSTMPSMTFDATLKESRIDLAKLAESVPALAGASGTVSLGGTVAQDATGSRARINCLFEKAGLSPTASSPVLLDGRLSYETDAAGADRLAGEGLSIEAAGQKGTLSLDLAGIRVAASGSTSPDALLEALRGSFRLGLPLYEWQKNKLTDIACTLALGQKEPSKLTASARVNQGACVAEALLSPRGEHTLRLTIDKANLDVSDARLLSLALPFIPAAGGRAIFTIQTDSRMLAAGLDPTRLTDTLHTPGIQKILLTDGFVEGSLLMGALAEKLKMVELSKIRFTKVEQDYEIRDRRITNHLTRIEGDVPMEIRGWTTFDGTMEHRILILGKMTEGDAQTARILRALNAAGGIRAHGNVTGPSVDVDYDKLAAKILEEELKSRRKGIEDEAKEKGKDLLEDLFKKKKKR